MQHVSHSPEAHNLLVMMCAEDLSLITAMLHEILKIEAVTAEARLYVAIQHPSLAMSVLDKPDGIFRQISTLKYLVTSLAFGKQFDNQITYIMLCFTRGRHRRMVCLELQACRLTCLI